jgi:hypothetical protein
MLTRFKTICIIVLQILFVQQYTAAQDCIESSDYKITLKLVKIQDSIFNDVLDSVINDEMQYRVNKDSILFVITSYFNKQDNKVKIYIRDPFYSCFVSSRSFLQTNDYMGYFYYKGFFFLLRSDAEKFRFPFEETNKQKEFVFPHINNVRISYWLCGNNSWTIIPLEDGSYSYFHRDFSGFKED